MRKSATTLPEYEGIVRLKTVAAYEFATGVGARLATSDSNAADLACQCGTHLGWMIQILDDIEALWFPIQGQDTVIERRTYPVLFGLTMSHPRRPALQQLSELKSFDRVQMCRVLDEMNVRPTLLNLALDHRDKAVQLLEAAPDPEGSAILRLWLDWLLRDGARLLGG